MAKSRSNKAEDLEQLVKAFQSGKSVVFADYQGMKVPAVTKLRKELHEAKVDYHVAKKTLFHLAAKQAGYEIDFAKMPGMLSAAFGIEDEMAPAKMIGDAGKTLPLKLVGGIFEGKAVDQTFVIALAKLPSKKQLLGQLLSVMNGPAAAFARLLNAKREKMEAGA